MSRIGLVLGGGGITGASFQAATLMSIEMACGWDPNSAEVIVGTSGGSYVTALVRSGRLDLDSWVRIGDTHDDVSERIRRHIFLKNPGVKVGRWLRHGVLPSFLNPGVTMLMGSPARYDATGVADWVESQVGDAAFGWPDRPTVITAYEPEARGRVAFGTVEAPDVTLADAVAASSAIPLVFHPYEIDGRSYVDGGVASGTHADLLLGSDEMLDLIIVVAPLAALEDRSGSWVHERILDRVGRRSLEEELDIIHQSWPETDILVLRPNQSVLEEMRPNPMAPDAAVPTFVKTLSAMKHQLAEPHIWRVLEQHCVDDSLGVAG